MKKRMIALITAALMVLTLPVYAFAGETDSASKAARAQSERAARTKAANEVFSIKGNLDYSEASDVLTIVNKERASAGAPALTMDVELQQAAMQRAAEIALFFSHDRPDGSSCFTVSDKASGENIAIGTNSAKAVMETWMDSPGHRRNILGEGYRSIGIGCFYQENGMKCWVQLFSGLDADTMAAGRGIKESVFSIPTNAEVSSKLKLRKDASDTLTMAKGKKRSAFSVYTSNAGWDWMTVKLQPQTFRWKSSGAAASVSESGTVTAKKEGAAVIKATLPVSGKTFSRKVTVKAAPKKAVLRSVKAGKRTLKVRWKRDKKASGYQVLIATNKKFTKGKKRAAISKNRITSKTFKKLKRKKVYYAKVRAYKKVGNTKLYGSYSKVKRARVK